MGGASAPWSKKTEICWLIYFKFCGRIQWIGLELPIWSTYFGWHFLYYTDILALLVVVEAYIWDIRRSDANGSEKTSVDALRAHASLQSLAFLVVGLIALVFRQTNIFWVSVFMGGLQVVRTVRQNTKPCTSTNFSEIPLKSFQGELYDPLVEEASFSGKSILKLL